MASQTIDVRVGSNGRMVLPLAVRQAMGLQGDTKIILTVENDEVRMTPLRHGVSRAQALYRAHAKHTRTTDAFLEDRRDEAAQTGDSAEPSE